MLRQNLLPGAGFGFRVSNYNSRPSSGHGTAVTASASADTYGSYAECISDTVVTEDCYGIYIYVHSGVASANERSATLTVGKDDTGGTSYTDWLEHLICGNSGLNAGSTGMLCGHEYYFPMYIKAGTALAAKYACSTGSTSARVMMMLFGRPKNPSEVWAATKFQGFGAAPGDGTALTSGTTSEGSWTQVGSGGPTNFTAYWWQFGMQLANATQTNLWYNVDLARGDGSNKHIIFQDQPFLTNTAEKNCKPLLFGPQYVGRVTPNDNLYMRAQCSGTPDSGIQVAAYGVG